jgi:hypothetical protein
MQRHTSVEVAVLEDIRCESRSYNYSAKKLFSADEYSKRDAPVSPIPIAAGQWLTLRYTGTPLRNRVCSMYVRVLLESGKNYSVVDGLQMPDGLAMFYKPSTCSFSILDDETKLPLPLVQIENVCQK